MFYFPSLPPKSYELRDVNQNTVSNQEFTPYQEPRITLPQLALYAYPIFHKENEPADPKLLKVEKPHSHLIEKWTNLRKAWWLPKPNVDDYQIHDVYKKYNVVVDPDYNPKYQHKEKVFYRPYQFEFDCIECMRQEKIQDKMAKDLGGKTKTSKHDYKLSTSTKKECKLPAPKWWREEKKTDIEEIDEKKEEDATTEEPSPSEGYMYGPPQIVKYDPKNEVKLRRCEMLGVGEFFRNDMLHWYYKNYPPPNFKPVIHKFSK